MYKYQSLNSHSHHENNRENTHRRATQGKASFLLHAREKAKSQREELKKWEFTRTASLGRCWTHSTLPSAKRRQFGTSSKGLLPCRRSHSEALGIYHSTGELPRVGACAAALHSPTAAGAEPGTTPGNPRRPGPGALSLGGRAANAACSATVPTPGTCRQSPSSPAGL